MVLNKFRQTGQRVKDVKVLVARRLRANFGGPTFTSCRDWDEYNVTLVNES